MDIVTSDEPQTDALLTARALVLHDLEVTSTAEQGTTFSVVLPRSDAALLAPPQQQLVS